MTKCLLVGLLFSACEKETELVEIPDSVIQSIADQAATKAANAAATAAATTAANAVASSVKDAAETAVDNAFQDQAEANANQVNDDPLPPSEYEFTRNGVSTVYYTGQTSRLKMAVELHAAFSDVTKTEADILAMFNDGTGFSDTSLTKNVGGKTGASSYASTTVKPQIQAFIKRVVDKVFPFYNDDASKGVPGKLTDSKRSIHIDEKGFEMNQIFTKSLMGALVTDQIINGYLWRGKLDAGTNIANNDNGVYEYTSPGASAANVTKMEHYWDEGFGYLYGMSDQYSESISGSGILVDKYLKKNDIPGDDKVIYDAFKLGRAAIVAKDYELKDKQAKIIKVALSKVIGYRAAYYLRSGATKMAAGTPADGLHALSEGYGFVLSLQFTMNEDGDPYFTNAEVNKMLEDLEAGDGFWDRTSAELNAMADQIDAASGLSTK